MYRPTVEEIMNILKGNQQLDVFMQSVGREESYRRLLFTHHTDMFGIEGEHLMHAFPLSGEFHIDTYVPAERTRVVEYLAEMTMQQDISRRIMENLGLGPETKQYSDFLDIIAYILIHAARSNKDVVDLISSPNFNYQLMKEKLGDIQEFITSALTSAGKEGSPYIDDTSSIVAEKAEKVASALRKHFESDKMGLLGSFSRIMPNLRLPLLLISVAWHRSVLQNADMEYDEYFNLMNALYLHKLIDLEGAILWCDSCALESPSYVELHGRAAPDKMTKYHCLTCKQPYSFSALYEPSENFKKALLCKDGFLSVYLAWMLKSEEIPFECNQYAGGREIDFLVKDTLVECKVLRKRTIDDRTAVTQELRKTVQQIEKHVRSCVANGRNVSRAILVWNLDEDVSSATSSLNEDFASFFQELDFKIIGPAQFDQFVLSLKA